jgi:hypothetical protein
VSAGRTTWWPKDAAWHRRELIVELGEEFGAEGPMVVDVLSSWAQEQRAAGRVRGGFRVLAREAFVTVSHAQSIVERAGEIGAIDDLEIDPDGRRFACRVSGWQADQERGRAALRQAAKRNREPEQTEDTVTDRDTSRPVTPSTQPDLTKPEEETPLPPKRGSSRRVRDREKYDAQIAAFAAEHFPGVDVGLVRHGLVELDARGIEATPEALRPWVDRWGGAA